MSEEITTIDTSSFKNKIESLNGKKVRINYSNNTYYEGIVVNGKPTEGTIHINGKNYKVENSKIKDKLNITISNQDKENGLGFILYSNGDVYEGELKTEN